ncbi:N-acetyltransferase [Erythrobacter sp. JK5]|uniref:GNAT family N-acetyltransferase n=1 Tax=Erythrobacter sp. JK5 TaxID=2829500 RepID=UPI001BABAD1E|nr:GNAT family N-acetyltransferase [Erythrobacter sp. JK5]QUL38522.1 GNAT family N-acetyltransferase [Erythrobacter sp. JK5]
MPRNVERRWIDRSHAQLLDRVAPGTFDHAIDPVQLDTYLASPGNWLGVALHGDLVVGMVMCVVHHHPDKPTELFLDEIGTGDDWRRQGIARSLVQFVFDRADAEGIEEIWLGTEPDNLAARGLYEGFRHEREDAVIYFFDW